MKLICSQSDLSSGLSLVSRAVPSKPTHPVLANIKLEADAETNQVSLTGFDLSLGIKTTFHAEVEASGEITLPAKLLTDIVSRFPNAELTLDNEEEEELCHIYCGTARYQVRGMSSEEFPELPNIQEGEVINLPTLALIDGLKGALFATSGDETKQVLTGVHLIVKTDSLEFAATDGHRLSVVETTNQEQDEDEEITPSAEAFELTVPARALRELEKIVSVKNEAGQVSFHMDQGQIVFELGNQRLTSRTLDGQYPNYRQLIPREFEKQITVDRKQLISSLERIAVLADQKNNLVKFSLNVDNQELFLSVETQDVGSGREGLSAQISGEDMDIAFNIKYLLEGLKALATAEITMQLNTPSSPVIISPLGGVKMTYLVMPVQIRN
jgi:DNA polymerase III subunit beta